MDNEDLGKDLYNDENVAKIDNVGIRAAGSSSDVAAIDGRAGATKIQTAADLFGEQEGE